MSPVTCADGASRYPPVTDSLSFSKLLASIRSSGTFGLEVEHMLQREDERCMKIVALVNTMFPPLTVATPQQSVEFKVFGEVMTILIDSAMAQRFGLGAIRANGAMGLPAGPDANDSKEWRALIYMMLLEPTIAESLENDSMTDNEIEYLMNKYERLTGESTVDLHARVIEELANLAPVVMHNMYAYLRTGAIVIPGWVVRSSGNHASTVRSSVRMVDPMMIRYQQDPDSITTERVFLLDKKKNLVTIDRHVITYSEMEYLGTKRNGNPALMPSRGRG